VALAGKEGPREHVSDRSDLQCERKWKMGVGLVEKKEQGEADLSFSEVCWEPRDRLDVRRDLMETIGPIHLL